MDARAALRTACAYLPLAKAFGAFIPNIIIQFKMFVMQIECRISSLLEYFIEMHLICLQRKCKRAQ